MNKQYANVIVDISHESVDRVFQYLIPDAFLSKIEVGVTVQIPFGKGNTLRKGYVIGVTDRADYDESKIKPIAGILEKEIGPKAQQLRLATWMRARYGSTMITALKTVLPVKQKTQAKQKKTVRRLLSGEETGRAALFYESKHQNAKARLMKELAENEMLSGELVTGKLHISAATLRTLEKAGQIEITEDTVYRNPVKETGDIGERKQLSPEQREAAERVLSAVRNEEQKNFLLYGITGSGKTEVYLEIVEGVVRAGKQAIVLIPEIALTYQTVIRFYKRFGDRVSIVNSRLSAGEKYDQFEKAQKGLIDVMIGPRSALFTPFPNIGAIIIDEEHESSYKSENMPKYHAREVALFLAECHKACVVLGSATPSLEAYYMVQKGEMELLKLTKRLTGNTLPNVAVVDLREELRMGNRSIFSDRLATLMKDRLEKGEQMMLFLNRRGYAGFISCRACGKVMKCPHCDVSLSQHGKNRLVCHYCGYERDIPPVCPECGSKYLLGFKAGTQQVEEAVKKMFPTARTLRMDADTTRKKESYDEILSSFMNEEADVLIGTQMIVKGHDFPKVTLVGILAADLSLNGNDYRAAERTFDLLTQAAGRAGRGESAGEVVIQTYQPEHYSIVHAAKQDYEAFYKEEISYRDFLLYPPVGHMMAVQIQSPDEQKAQSLANRLKQASLGFCKEHEILAIGPSTAPIAKIKDIYRQVLYYKQEDLKELIKVRELLEEFLEKEGKGTELVYFDYDPVNVF